MSRREPDLYKVRLQPTDLTQKTPNYKHSARIFIHPAEFVTFGFTSGCLCNVEIGPVRREAIAWLQPDRNVGKGIVTVSRAFQRAAGLKLEDVVRVTPAGDVPCAASVIARPSAGDISSLVGKEHQRWEFELERRLDIFPGLLMENLSLNGAKYSFVVESVNGSSNNVAKYTPGSTRVTIPEEHAPKQPERSGKLKVTGIPGLHSLLDALYDDFLRFFEAGPNNSPAVLRSCGIVIHGSRGTGKSMLLDHLAATNWGTVVRIDFELRPSMVSEEFKAAIDRQTPSIILIDQISDLIGETRPNRASYIKAIGNGLDALAAQTVKLGRRPEVVVVATCVDYFNDIPDELRRHTRFGRHIAIPIPDAAARKEILRSWCPGFRPKLSEQHISDIGDRTHAYSPDDLHKVCEHATLARFRRVKDISSDEPFSWADINTALKEVRPTVMQGINLKPPTVHWSEIGGYDNVKAVLQTVMVLPSTNANKPSFKPPTGILLYGPPGCSKTMTAQAIATEWDFNFFAVKGGELLNMYVGETERSIRNLFARAQEASPSIVFFDEIDAIAGFRTGDTGGGVQALTTLLNEMDGFESKGGVFVLAATNKPDALDGALLRPGRFDEIIHVPLPDERAREAILARKVRELRFPAGDLDMDALVRLLEGYSGAEISRICDRAFMGVDLDCEYDAMAVLRSAIQKTPKLVTREMLDRLERWHDTVQYM
ncbi:hypothetical protein DL764_005419 [Monosporascus ibericus]|uniref:AAA+ ATPase domain-containing protein n=1 Tax=Monosporascus ibericus TaxID=155417 RepID=A0A4Q4TCB1_9PEZI|nr:hypothetical protein DL764_005419 [Monosporascus ibericus]